MLKIRLQRVGRKNEPTFRLVVTDSKNGPKSGKSLEVVGSFDPRRENDIKQFKVDRIKHWMANGVKVSDTVYNFLVEKKVLTGKKLNVLPKKKPIVKEGEAAPAAAAPAPAAEAPKA